MEVHRLAPSIEPAEGGQGTVFLQVSQKNRSLCSLLGEEGGRLEKYNTPKLGVCLESFLFIFSSV